NDNHNTPTMPNGVAVGRNAHPTADENDYRVGFPAQQNAESVDNENVSGSLSKQRHPNKSATPIYSEIASPVTQARNDDKGNLNDNHNTPTMPNGVAVGRNAHPTADENDYRVGFPAQQNAESVDNENVSGSLKNNDTNEQGVAVDYQAHPTIEENISGSLNAIDLPELNAQNWHIIVQKLTPQLGANVLLAQHSSLVKVEDNQMTLSVHKSGELFRKPAHLSALGEVLAQHYGTQKNIHIIEWQDHFESASQAKQRHHQAIHEEKLKTLQQDPFAQKLQKIFGGEWVIK
ncbi:MAG: hypothetical protein IJ780_04025, partial [Neisseriaceae bacterium]|nr:hypothetical protein [Neisseriaceae bacterium]